MNDTTALTIQRRTLINQRFNWHLDLYGPARDAALDQVDAALADLDHAIAAAKRAQQ